MVDQPGEEKALWKPCCSLPILKGDLQERWRETLWEYSDRAKDDGFTLKEICLDYILGRNSLLRVVRQSICEKCKILLRVLG